jgi:WD40 repeat protein
LIVPHLTDTRTSFAVREYDLATGRHRDLFTLPVRSGIGLEQFALSPDGRLLLEGHPRDARLWDLTTGTERRHFQFRGGDQCFTFTPDGRQLVSAARINDGDTVRLWDLTTGKEARVLTRHGRDGVSEVVVSPDGRWLAAVEGSGVVGVGTAVTLWDLTGAQAPRDITLAERTWGGRLLFTADGQSLFAVSGAWPDFFVSRWDVQTGTMALRWGGPHGNSEFFPPAVAMSPDGGTVAVGSSAGVIRLFNGRTGTETVPTAGHSAFIDCAAFLPEGAVRTIGFDGVVTDWDIRTGRQRARRDLAAGVTGCDMVRSVAASPDGRWVVTKGNVRAAPSRGVVMLWEAATGTPKHTWTVGWWDDTFAFGPDGRFLVNRLRGKALRAWDRATGADLPAVIRPHDDAGTAFAVLGDGRTLLVCDAQTADGFDLTTGAKRFSWKLAENDVLGEPAAAPNTGWAPVRSVAGSPDGKLLAIGVGGNPAVARSDRKWNVVLVEAETGKVLRRVATPDAMAGLLVFSPDGRWLASERSVWDAATLKEVRRFPEPPLTTAVAFSPDGRRVVTGHSDGTALVWRVGE